MVGRLVEYQQVNRFEQQADHSQTAALAAAEHLHLLVAGFTSKHEGSQNIVDAQTNLTLRHIVDGLENRQLLVQQLRLVLGEIAYLHVVAYLQMTLERNLVHDTLHQR